MLDDVETNAELTVTLPVLIERGPSGMHYAVVPSLGLVVCGEDEEDLAESLEAGIEAFLPDAEVFEDVQDVVDDALDEADKADDLAAQIVAELAAEDVNEAA